ncbi:MAG TPA: ABC transporter substrate-binding protein [Burkholderiaceae bacterium]|jgi:phospholipid transport system substrate-binding protein|nr:ABC transporter substrate-binding protein [Burkholderiaceae bacterium]
MQFLKTLVLTLAASTLLTTAAAQAPAATPDAMVRDLSNEVLNAIKEDKALKSGDTGRVQKLVDEKVLPYTDFQKMTQLSVGPGWRNATPEQRAALTREFRTLLVRTYSGALGQVSDHKVELRPYRAQPTDTDVIVRTQVVASRGDPIQLDYRLEKSDAGWKIYDINILGVWLVENYKSQFSSQVNSSGIDGLIKTLTERNSQLAQKKA